MASSLVVVNTDTNAEKHYQRHETYLMSLEDPVSTDGYENIQRPRYARFRYNAYYFEDSDYDCESYCDTDASTLLKNRGIPKIDTCEYDDPQREDIVRDNDAMKHFYPYYKRPNNYEPMVYTELSCVIKNSGKTDIRLFLKTNDIGNVDNNDQEEFMNVYYIRFNYFYRSRCICSRYERSCNCGYDYHDSRMYSYRMILSIRDNISYVIIQYHTVLAYFKQEDLAYNNEPGFQQSAEWLQQNKMRIRTFGKQLFETLQNRLQDKFLLEYLCSFL